MIAANETFAWKSADVSSRTRRIRRTIFTWLSSSFGSILLHLLIIAALFWALSGSDAGLGTGERVTDGVGIVFSESKPVDLSDSTSGESAIETAENVQNVELSVPSVDETTVRQTVEQFLPSNEIGTSNGTSSESLSDVFSNASSGGIGETTDGNEGQGVGFGGARGKGRKFVYVLDRSDSMSWNGGAPMRRAIADAVASISSLDPQQGAQKFQLISYNHDAEVFNQGTGLIKVDSVGKSLAIRYLKSLVPSGGTAPEQALELAIKMKPDVVFFLTDADEELSETALERVRTLRRQYRVKQICVVEFGKSGDSKKKTFRRMAGENGGTYVFRDVETF